MPLHQPNPARPRWAGLLALSLSAVAGGVAGYLLKERIRMAIAKTARDFVPILTSFIEKDKAEHAATAAENDALKAENADLKAKLDAAVAENADQEAAVGDLQALLPADAATPPADPTPPTETPAPEPAPA